MAQFDETQVEQKPHACGEKNIPYRAICKLDPKTPHLWGKVCGAGASCRKTTKNPTRVGKSFYGDDRSHFVCKNPTRVGKRICDRNPDQSKNPTHVGKSKIYRATHSVIALTKTPRVWGNNAFPRRAPGTKTPHLWGKVVIPGRTSSGSAQKPHTCGEKPGYQRTIGWSVTKTPRVWGKVLSSVMENSRLHKNPTPVGKRLYLPH